MKVVCPISLAHTEKTKEGKLYALNLCKAWSLFWLNQREELGLQSLSHSAIVFDLDSEFFSEDR